MNHEILQNWLVFYEAVHKKGAFINECLKINLMRRGSEKHVTLEEDLNFALSKCVKFLDRNGVRARKTPWQWKKEDPTTWPSSGSFAYKHLMK